MNSNGLKTRTESTNSPLTPKTSSDRLKTMPLGAKYTSHVQEKLFHVSPVRWDDMSTVQKCVRSSAEWYRKFVAKKDMNQHEVGKEWAASNFLKRNFYLGHHDNTPVGALSLQSFSDYSYVGYLYLMVDHVGKGFGKHFLKFAEKQARSEGNRGLYLIAHPEAKWAIRAYEKFGFTRHSTDRENILSWNSACLKGYYEEGFHLYVYNFKLN